jgi:hypothetical protein
MDHGTRYEIPSQDIRERTVEEEDEQALSEGEDNESNEMTSECTPRPSLSSPPSRAVFMVNYTFPYSIIRPQSVFTHLFPRHHGCLLSGGTITARAIAAFAIFSLVIS